MNILDEIIKTKKEEVKSLKNNFNRSDFVDQKLFHTDKISLFKVLSTKEKLGVIAEIKKASPSKGIIRYNFNHLEIAQTYLKNKVEAISVLTDEKYFLGSKEYLKSIAEIKTAPILRKDFIIDEYQIFEAKSIGADAVLLICEVLSESQILELTETATECDLEVLLELHSEDQLEKINFDKNKLIGINNRDLTTFNVDLNNTISIKKHLPSDILVVSESGIKNHSDLEMLKSNNIDAVLTGEHFMRAENISKSLAAFNKWTFYEN